LNVRRERERERERERNFIASEMLKTSLSIIMGAAMPARERERERERVFESSEIVRDVIVE